MYNVNCTLYSIHYTPKKINKCNLVKRVMHSGIVQCRLVKAIKIVLNAQLNK